MDDILEDDIDPELLEKLRADRELELYTIRTTMWTSHGRKMLYKFIWGTGVYTGTFNVDPYQNAYNSGLRAHGFSMIAELMAASPDLYFTMLKENQ